MGDIVRSIFGGGGDRTVYMPAPVINIPAPVTPEDPKVEEARLAAVSARQRAKGRDATIFTDLTLERDGAPVRKPALGA